MNEEKLKIDMELRSLSEKIKDGSIKAEDAKIELEKLSAQKRDIEQKIALANSPTETRTTNSIADIQKAMIEKRAITLSGTALVLQIKELVKEISRKTEIINGVRKFYGANGSTNIPVWSPTLAQPAAQTEGAASVAVDNLAKLGNKSLTPHAFVSILPVSWEALNLGSVNLESEFSEIFGDAFLQGWLDQIINGNGTGMNFDGLFNGLTQNIICSTAGSIKMADLAALALKLQDYNHNPVLIMNSSIYSAFIADDTPTAKLYAEEMIRQKTIEGVPILLTGSAPSATAAGSTICVGGDLSNYAFAIANELTVSPIQKVGDLNVYYHAVIAANGCKLIENKNFFGLKTK